MKRDLSSVFTENLEFLQSFEHVKIYYDNGQELVKRAPFGSIELFSKFCISA